MEFIKLLAVIFALSNFYFFVYNENTNLRKRFLIGFGIVLLFSLVFFCVYADNNTMLIEGTGIITGYFIILFLVHLLLIKIFRIRKYYLYQFVFFLLFFLFTVFYIALMQSVFKYS